jgi:hypothetical protein
MGLKRTWKAGEAEEILDCDAEIHDYSGFGKIMVELDFATAKRLVEEAVKNKKQEIEIIHNGKRYPARMIDTRTDTFDPKSGNQLNSKGQPTVCTFGNMTWKV